MITDNYIKMCEQAEELQREWKPNTCDNYYSKIAKDLQIIINEDLNLGLARINKLIENNNYVWLPTLEQLFDKWCYLCKATNFAGLCQRIIECERSKVATYPNINLVKELCLEAIMKEFYHKTWTGEKWEVMK